MAECEKAKTALGDQHWFQFGCRLQSELSTRVQHHTPMDRHRVRTSDSGACPGGHLHRSQRFFQSRRFGSGGRNWIGSSFAPGVVSPRASGPFSLMAERAWNCLRGFFLVCRRLADDGANTGSVGLCRRDLLWGEWFPDHACCTEENTISGTSRK